MCVCVCISVVRILLPSAHIHFYVGCENVDVETSFKSIWPENVLLYTVSFHIIVNIFPSLAFEFCAFVSAIQPKFSFFLFAPYYNIQWPKTIEKTSQRRDSRGKLKRQNEWKDTGSALKWKWAYFKLRVMYVYVCGAHAENKHTTFTAIFHQILERYKHIAKR